MQVANACRNALKKEGYEVHEGHGHFQFDHEYYTLHGKGFRICIDQQLPLFSFQMDADLALEYQQSRNKFDSVCKSALGNIVKTCDDHSVELLNQNDLDFSYTDSTNAYSILKSKGAENISDPLVIAIRDWHRKRGL